MTFRHWLSIASFGLTVGCVMSFLVFLDFRLMYGAVFFTLLPQFIRTKHQ